MKRTGISIILIGLGLIIFTTFTSFTREKVVDTEIVKMGKNVPQEFHWYPLLGICIIGMGALVLQKST